VYFEFGDFHELFQSATSNQRVFKSKAETSAADERGSTPIKPGKSAGVLLNQCRTLFLLVIIILVEFFEFDLRSSAFIGGLNAPRS
jgi:hypothetical protein